MTTYKHTKLLTNWTRSYWGMIILSDKTETTLSGGHQKQHEWVCSIRTTSTSVHQTKLKKTCSNCNYNVQQNVNIKVFEKTGWPTERVAIHWWVHRFPSFHLNYCLFLTSSSLFIYLKDSGHIVLLYVSFKAFELIFYHDYKFISDFALYTV